MSTFYKKSLVLLLGAVYCVGLAFASNSFMIESESLKLKVYPRSGHFSLYRISKAANGSQYKPLFDTRNGSMSTRFSLLANKNMYHLESKVGNGRIHCELDGNKIVLSFNIASDFIVKQTFQFVDQTFKNDGAALKIDTSIENIGEMPLTASLFAVVDTTLGESIQRHFFTNNFKQIGAETKFDPNDPGDAVLISSGDDVASIFYLNSESSTAPAYVHALHWDRAYFRYRAPELKAGSAFTTAKRPNDSALLFAWPVRVIDAGYRSGISMIIGSSDSASEDFPHFTTTAHVRDEGDTKKAPTAITAPLIGINDEVGNFAGRRPNFGKNLTKDELRLEIARLLRDMERAIERPDNYSDSDLHNLYNAAGDSINQLED